MDSIEKLQLIAAGGLTKTAAELNISALLGLSANVKALHVQTRKYSQHKALDDAFEELNETIDKFNECVQGYYINKTGKRLKLSNSDIRFTLPTSDSKMTEAIQQLERKFRRAADAVTDESSVLLSLRDDVQACFYQLYYLLDLN